MGRVEATKLRRTRGCIRRTIRPFLMAEARIATNTAGPLMPTSTWYFFSFNAAAITFVVGRLFGAVLGG